jgi:site-specific DNA-methyltransferase (adenine-specific)
MKAGSVGGIVSDPPYGLDFMGKEWDKLDWQAGGGFSKPGIGDRHTNWPSFSATSKYGATNPTCAECGGRLRGAKKCGCVMPHDHWKPIGKRKNPENEGLPDNVTGSGMSSQMVAIQAWHAGWLHACYRVLVPGGRLLAFGGSRVYHRMAAAFDDAGFVDVGIKTWNYGSGFPKSMSVSSAIDKAARGTPQGSTKGDPKKRGKGALPSREVFAQGGSNGKAPTGLTSDYDVYVPETDAAKAWEGWGTALKPSWEPVIVGRKPE